MGVYLWYLHRCTRVAGPSEYLAITGPGIAYVKVAKEALLEPGQRCISFWISPAQYRFKVKAMSAEKLPFILLAVFTIGPHVEDRDSILRYAKFLSTRDRDRLPSCVKELVQVIIERETLVLAASMTMEEIFRGTESFEQEVSQKAQLALKPFGLIIYNAYLKQFVDDPGHEYFSGQETQQEAANQARVDVAKAKKKGDIGIKERRGQRKKYASKIDAETKIYSTQREGEGTKVAAAEGVFRGAMKKVCTRLLPIRLKTVKTVQEQTGMGVSLPYLLCNTVLARPSQYLAISGRGIADIKVAKKVLLHPGQRFFRFHISPVQYTFWIKAEKLSAELPSIRTVFTIGPRVEDMDSILRYARFLSTHDRDRLSSCVKELVQRIIGGKILELPAFMTMEEIFCGSKSFKQELFKKVQLELNQFGLFIYNVNFKQLVNDTKVAAADGVLRGAMKKVCTRLLPILLKMVQEQKIAPYPAENGASADRNASSEGQASMTGADVIWIRHVIRSSFI